MESLREALLNLVQISGPTGYENKVSTHISNTISKVSENVKTDKMGNVIANINSKTNAPTILLLAHMDEVSMVVTRVKNNFVYFNTVGTINSNILFSQSVSIVKDDYDIPGVVCTPSVHLDQDFKELWIDVGERGDEIEPGDMIVFDSGIRWLNDNNTILATKALDNRVGCTILIDLAKKIKELNFTANIIFGFTVQEEIGARGAKYVANNIKPDYIISVDTALADDPTEESLEQYKMGTGQVELGKGPIIRVFEALNPDRGGFINFSDKKLVNDIKSTGKKNNIECILDASFNLYTDAAGANESCPDAKSCCIGVPRRYSHSSNEVIDIKVMDTTIKLLGEYLKEFWTEK